MWSAKFGWYVFCSLIVSALLCVAETNVQPHRVNAYQVSVKSNYFTFGVGNGTAWQYIRLGTDPTNFTVQDAFNWIDSNWVNVVGALMNTNDWVLLKPTNTTVQAVFNWIDANLSTNTLTVAQASNMFKSATNAFIVNQAQSTNIGSGVVQQVHMSANSIRGSNIVDGSVATADMATQRAFHVTSGGGTTVISVPGAADLTMSATPARNTMGTWNGSTTLVITNAGVYSFDAEAHFPGADLNFRDINKIVQVVWNGSDIANAKADGADAIVTISGHYAFPLDSGTGQLKLVATIQTNVGYALSKPVSVTCSFARMRMVLIGPYQDLGL